MSKSDRDLKKAIAKAFDAMVEAGIKAIQGFSTRATELDQFAMESLALINEAAKKDFATPASMFSVAAHKLQCMASMARNTTP